MKKNISVFIMFFVMIGIQFSCRDAAKRDLPSSAGAPAAVLIKCSSEVWKELESVVRHFVDQPFEGLPQIEPCWDLTHIAPSQFTQIFKSSHSIIQLVKDTVNQIRFTEDIWVQPQSIITISGKSTLEIVRLFRKNFHKLYERLHNFQISRLQWLQSKQPLLASRRLLDTIDLSTEQAFIPSAFHLALDQKDFLWYRSETSKGSQNLIFYRFPIPDPLPTYLDDWLVKERDRYVRRIKGQLPESYMQTERSYLPYFYHKALSDERLLVEVKGLWKLEGDFMGGPFISYFLMNPSKSIVYVFEGFVYAPSAQKRDNMLYLEALLKRNIYQ